LDFETHAPGSTLTEALLFRQEGHPELKCYSALKSLVAKYGGVVDNHATSNPAISDVKRGKKRVKTASLSLIQY